MSKITQSFIALLSILMLISPVLAEAKAGGGKSFGSRGTRTYNSMPSARPIERSTTPRPAQTQQPAYNSPGYMPPAAPAGGGFLRGLAGGFLGAGLFSMLFGHSAMGAGMGGEGGGMGILPMLLLAFGAYYLFKKFRNQGNNSTSSAEPATLSAAPTGTPIEVTDTDKRAFEQLFTTMQLKWGEGDINALSALLTPELLQYFKEELAVNSSNGVANKIEMVKLDYAEMIESWHEYDLDYATARMRWSSIDYMAKLGKNPSDADYVASGDNHTPKTDEEIWTFVRSQGGRWLLSAIQQVN